MKTSTKLSSALIAAAAFSSAPAFAAATDDPQKPETNDSIQPATYDMLDEVVVTAQKPLVQANGEKVSYNVDEDPASKTSNVLEMLRKVPSVTVDGQDKIQVNGQSNFKIYVNGKEDPMLSSNPGQILKAMPASSIVKIEVITEPGAKYDAEGTAGILNFITVRKQRTDGYAGSVSLGVASENINAGAYARAKYRNVTGSAHFEFADNHIHPQNNINRSTTEYIDNPVNRFNLQETAQEFSYDYYGGGLDLSWEPDTLNLFTVNFNIRHMKADIEKFNQYVRMLDPDRNLLSSYRQKAMGGSLLEFGFSAGASYQHTFRRQGHHLILSYLYNQGQTELELRRRYTEMTGFQAPEFNSILSDNTNHEHTAQLDYAIPFGGEKHLVEAGLKGVFRRNDGIGNEHNGDRRDDMKLDPSSVVDIKQFQDVAAAYASYSGTFGSYSVKGGLRYEHTRMGIDFRKGDTPDFTTRLNDIVPNAAVSYSFAPAHSLRLAYQMRISRPSLNQVNPFQLKLTDNMVQMGNPDLTSERSNKITLTYTNFGRTFGGNVSIEYSQIDNAISEYNYVADDVIYTTHANLGKNRSAALSGFLNCNISAKMRLSLNGRLQYTDLNSPNPLFGHDTDSSERLRASGWTGNFGASFNYTMPGNVKLNAYGGKNFGWIQLSSRSNGWYYYGISFSRSFLRNDALTVTASASNFLTEKRKFISRSHTETTRSYGINESRSWNVGVSVSWNFGNLQSRVKKTAANIENDDKSSSGNSKGGIM